MTGSLWDPCPTSQLHIHVLLDAGISEGWPPGYGAQELLSPPPPP